jgi:hypothetical protein
MDILAKLKVLDGKLNALTIHSLQYS